MDHVAGPLHSLLAKKDGRVWFNIVCLKLYQFKRITWWCLFIKKSRALVGMLKKNPGDHETVSKVRYVGLHVDFSSMKSSLGL